jgi:hypothetical protein
MVLAHLQLTGVKVEEAVVAATLTRLTEETAQDIVAQVPHRKVGQVVTTLVRVAAELDTIKVAVDQMQDSPPVPGQAGKA